MPQTKSQREWYFKNRDRLIERSKLYRRANIVKCRAYDADYSSKNKNRIHQKQRAWYLLNRQRAIKKASDYYYKNIEIVRGKAKQYQGRFPEQRMARWRKYYAKNKQKDSARKLLQTAVKTGRVVRPKTCPECGLEGMVEAHHHLGYDKHHALDVVWRCKRCHWKLHRKTTQFIYCPRYWSLAPCPYLASNWSLTSG